MREREERKCEASQKSKQFSDGGGQEPSRKLWVKPAKRRRVNDSHVLIRISAQGAVWRRQSLVYPKRLSNSLHITEF